MQVMLAHRRNRTRWIETIFSISDLDEEKAKNPDFKPKRWAVEVCHSWFAMKNGSELYGTINADRRCDCFS